MPGNFAVTFQTVAQQRRQALNKFNVIIVGHTPIHQDNLP